MRIGFKRSSCGMLMIKRLERKKNKCCLKSKDFEGNQTIFIIYYIYCSCIKRKVDILRNIQPIGETEVQS